MSTLFLNQCYSMGQSNKKTIKFRIFPGFQLLGSNLTKLAELCGNEGLVEEILLCSEQQFWKVYTT